MANKLSFDKKVTAVSMLCEGNSIRSIERMTGVHRDTIMRLGVRVGDGLHGIQDELFNGVDSDRIEVDEMWGFIGCKRRTAKIKESKKQEVPAGHGDVWVWVALCADTKLVPCHLSGQRDAVHANAFMGDLASRVNGHPQIDTDGLAAYRHAIASSFGDTADHASLIKTYADDDIQAQRRYSPATCTGIKKVAGQGDPDMDVASTSYVEKQNHTVRMHCRRLSRLTNAFSKKRENFDAAISLHYAYYNLVKVHGTIKTTPALEAGMVDRKWTVADLVEQTEGR